MTRQEAEKKLKEIFKIDRFYDTQWDVIEKTLKGERVLLIERTGYGKSLCFQFPAVHFTGTTIIFTPLLALMRDQVKKLQALGIAAKCINSNQPEEENSAIIEEALNNKIKILYIAPERMENAEWLNSARQMNISMVVVDEAHCISTWGHDFRPAYKRIMNLVNLLPKEFPVLATTATATRIVEEDVRSQIGKNAVSIRGNLMRKNLRLFVIKVESEEEKMVWLAQNLVKIEGNGLVYTGTRVNTEIYSRWFNFVGMTSAYYNADLDSAIRQDIEQGLIENRWKCIVSTNALGMGIDKPDIRFIVHTQAPISPIHYYQEIGRAGRDGNDSFIILLYNPNEDNELPKAFIESAKPDIKKYHKAIRALKSARLGEHELIKATNLKHNEIRVIKADLIEQGIINEVAEGRTKKYEMRFNAPELDEKPFVELKKRKTEEFYHMLDYVYNEECRMKFLCNYLGDDVADNCKKCDFCSNHVVVFKNDAEWAAKLTTFQEDYFPPLEVETKKSNIINGVAASYYGVSNIGAMIHKCKYENGGDFPDHLLKLTLKAFRKKYGDIKFDMLLYVPPTISGELVKNFANKLSSALKIPISNNLFKFRDTKPQKNFRNWLLKRDNVSSAFIYSPENEISGKNILLIDDIFDSGATVKEIGRYLTSLGANIIAPLVIAKTIGADINEK